MFMYWFRPVFHWFICSFYLVIILQCNFEKCRKFLFFLQNYFISLSRFWVNLNIFKRNQEIESKKCSISNLKANVKLHMIIIINVEDKYSHWFSLIHAFSIFHSWFILISFPIRLLIFFIQQVYGWMCVLCALMYSLKTKSKLSNNTRYALNAECNVKMIRKNKNNNFQYGVTSEWNVSLPMLLLQITAISVEPEWVQIVFDADLCRVCREPRADNQ